MTLQVKGRLAALLFCFLICVGCGDVYRPTIIPQPPQPPDPKNAHSVFTVNQNGSANPGTGMQVNVSGDSAAGVTKVANMPVHAVLQGGRVWVANQGSNSVSAFTVAAGSISPIGTSIDINLPGGPTPDVVPAPAFVYSTETATMYVANTFEHSSNPNFNGTVAVINSITNTISNTVPVGKAPIAMTETPSNTATTGLTKKLYVVDRDDSTDPRFPTPIPNGVMVIQASDQTQVANIPFPAGSSPRWVVSRDDGARVYVLSHDAGTITVINSLVPVDTIIGSPIPVGAGADFLYYDSRTNRLYVPNPTNSKVTILDASTDSLPTIATIDLTAPIPAGGAPCPNSGCSPTSVTALPDGSRAYVASYYIDTTSANCQQTACLQAQVTVIDERTNQVTKSIPLPQVSVSPVGNCGSVRFRISATKAIDGSRVYVSSCDAGEVLTVNPSGDVFFATVPAPVSAFSPTLLTITQATQTGAQTTYSYTYTQPTANTPIHLGLIVTITGMSQAGDNGTFTVTGLGNGTFTVTNTAGTSSSGENGTGIGQPPSQNPVFMLTGS